MNQDETENKAFEQMKSSTTNEDTWQKCPSCYGTGASQQIIPYSNSTTPVCTVCRGKKIISRVTGKPPKD
jgi:DnaJ-class molecular chaperone